MGGSDELSQVGGSALVMSAAHCQAIRFRTDLEPFCLLSTAGSHWVGEPVSGPHMAFLIISSKCSSLNPRQISPHTVRSNLECFPYLCHIFGRGLLVDEIPKFAAMPLLHSSPTQKRAIFVFLLGQEGDTLW